MVLFYAGVAWVAVWTIFRSPALDYRLVMLGAVLPVVELPLGTGPLHTLLAPVGVLVFLFTLWRSTLVTLRQGGVRWRGTLYKLAEMREAAR